MTQNSVLLPFSVEDFLAPDEVKRILQSIDRYREKVDRSLLEAGGRGFSIHSSQNLTVAEIVKVYEPQGRVEINWNHLPAEVCEIVELAFFRRIEDIRRAFPTAFGPIGYTYVEYGPGQYFTAHLDGASTHQVAGFGVTLSDDFDGGEFRIETCGSGSLWLDTPDATLSNAPGHDANSSWFGTVNRTQWSTRPVVGNAIFYGSGLTHSSAPVTRGVLKKILAFIRSVDVRSAGINGMEDETEDLRTKV